MTTILVAGKPVELCEWWPAQNKPATGAPGEQCPNPATVSVGLRNNWHLCDSCASLPAFARKRRRVRLNNGNPNPTVKDRTVTTTATPTITTTDDARSLLAQLAESNDWVSVFWDKGWGDSPLEISIIVDGDGQAPRAYLTNDVYRQLLADGTIRVNSLKTYKARRLHDYRTPKPEEKTGPDANDVAEQVIRRLFGEHPDWPMHAEFYRGLDPDSRLPRNLFEYLDTPTREAEWFVRLLPGCAEIAVSAAGEYDMCGSELIGTATVVDYPRNDGDVDLEALNGPEFRARLVAVVEDKLTAIKEARG